MLGITSDDSNIFIKVLKKLLYQILVSLRDYVDVLMDPLPATVQFVCMHMFKVGYWCTANFF